MYCKNYIRTFLSCTARWNNAWCVRISFFYCNTQLSVRVFKIYRLRRFSVQWQWRDSVTTIWWKQSKRHLHELNPVKQWWSVETSLRLVLLCHNIEDIWPHLDLEGCRLWSQTLYLEALTAFSYGLVNLLQCNLFAVSHILRGRWSQKSWPNWLSRILVQPSTFGFTISVFFSDCWLLSPVQ